MKNFKKLVLFSALLPATLAIEAAVRMPAIFSDNMVLEQKTDAAIWGSATPGEKVTILTSWSKAPIEIQTPESGRWRAVLPTPKACENQTITIKASNEIIIRNVLVGEVWMCSGQSNMEFPLCKNPKARWQNGVIDEAQQMKDVDYPSIRLFRISQATSPDTLKYEGAGRWEVCDSATVKNFSAIGFLFGRDLYKSLKTPVGLVQAAVGSSHAESWTKPEVIQGDPVYKAAIDQYEKDEADYPIKMADYKQALESHEQAVAAAKAKGETFSGKRPKKPRAPKKIKSPSTLWNAMVNPVVPYSFKGVIWYQGESNSIRSNDYCKVFTNLINSWRQEFENPEMPFYFVQIAPHNQQPPQIREAQLQTWQSVKNTGMVVITDAGDPKNIHPRNKQIPASRLAAWALAKDYGKKVAFSGPLFKDMKVKGSQAVLSFDYLGSGLKAAKGDSLYGFEIADIDDRYFPAKAVIKGKNIILSSPRVQNPRNVRYGWGKFFEANLSNKEGLPASPFRTQNSVNISDFAQKTSVRFAESEIRRFPQAWQSDHGKKLNFGYAQGVECCAMLRLAELTGDERYYKYVEQWCDTLVENDGSIKTYKVQAYNLDFINPGKPFFEVYERTKNKKYKKALDLLVRQLSNQPTTLEGAFWHKIVYKHQVWLDGLYMGAPFLAQYGATFNKPELIDIAVNQFIVCARHTYDPATGLYYHAWDESKTQKWADPATGHSPNFWGRSMGWWFMALVDVLDYVPQTHPDRAQLVEYVKGLAATLPKYQKDGLWYQVIDQGEREGNYQEASATSMFMYAIAKAVNKGYVDDSNLAAAKAAYDGLMKTLIKTEADGSLTLTKCCAVAGLGGRPYRDGSFEYYVNERIRENDAKATGPFIMGCIELNK